MHRARILTLGLLVVLFAVNNLAPAYASDDYGKLRLKTIRTKDLRLIYYDDGHQYITEHLAKCFENSMSFHKEMFGYTPTREIAVLLQDFDDIGYAGATGVPFNWMMLGIEPFEYVYEVSPTNERMNWVMSHELLHIVASDQASPMDRFFRTLFHGKIQADDKDPVSLFYSYLTAPRRYAPRWYHEGMAVFLETWMSAGFGRAIGGYDEMVFRAMVADGARFHTLIGLESEGTTTDFQVGQNAYLYGTRFISYMGLRYGPEKVIAWLTRSAGSKGRYSAQFSHVFGKGLSEAWKEWIEWEHEWQEANLERVLRYPLTEYRVLSRQPLGSVSRSYYDSDSRKLYTGVLYPHEFGHIAEIDIDSWHVEKIANIPTPAVYYVTSLAYDDVTDELFFTTDNQSGFRDLHKVGVRSRDSRQLLHDSRVGDIAFNKADRSIWGIRHHNGKSRIVRIAEPHDYMDWADEIVTLLPFEVDIFDIDISPDGKYLTASQIFASGKRQLIRFSVDSLMTPGARIEEEVLFELDGNKHQFLPANFVHSPDGRYLFGTAYYSGVSNVYRFDFETRTMEIITNTDTGFFRPVPVSDDSLIVFKYTSKGFLPVMVAIEPIDVLGYAPDVRMADTTGVASGVGVVRPQPKEGTTVHEINFLGEAIQDTHPIVQQWNIGTPRDIDLAAVTIEEGDYHGIRNIELTSVYPIVQSYKTRVAYGVRLNFSERAVLLHELDIRALYSPGEGLPDDEKGHVETVYNWWPWKFSATWNKSDFYDFFGPTKTSRKGYSAAVEYSGNLIHERPTRMSYSVDVAGYGGLEVLPQYQNVRVALFDEYLSMGASVSYEKLLKTIGGVEKEKGMSWQLNVRNNWVNPKNASSASSVVSDRHNYPRAWLDLNYGFLLPWNHSSVWFRPSVGGSFDPRSDRDEPLNNFYFGGFGNNWVDHGSVRRYRENYALPGIELNELGGTTYGKLTLEWVLPPVRFTTLGVPAMYANWAHLALFASGITTNVDDRSLRRELVSVGAQLDIKIVSFFSKPYTFSIGYGGAMEEGRPYSDEFMISLKIF